MPRNFALLARAALFGVILAGAAAVPVASSAEETTGNAPFTSTGTAPAGGHDLIQGAHVEGHIAFLKAELGITQQQDQLWQAVASAMREDVRNLNDAERKALNQQKGPETAVQYLENRVIFAHLRADGEERFLQAFKPLYAALSSEQRATANELLIPDENN